MFTSGEIAFTLRVSGCLFFSGGGEGASARGLGASMILSTRRGSMYPGRA